MTTTALAPTATASTTATACRPDVRPYRSRAGFRSWRRMHPVSH